MNVFAIDPGNDLSAYCIIDVATLRPIEFDKLPNNEIYTMIRSRKFDQADRAAIEMVESFGMPVGREVFETVYWIGRYYETLGRKLIVPPDRILRHEEKLHICHDSRAKDANISRALKDRFCTHDLRAGKGTKKHPDFFYGFKADCWSAYAVGLTFIETKLDES